MVNEQLAITTAETTPNGHGEAPRCRLCSRPARWLRNRNQWGMYCNGYNCNNRERNCRTCGQIFEPNAKGAGSKYCSTECKLTGYNPNMGRSDNVMCAWGCGRSGYRHKHRNPIWPYICRECQDPIKHVVDRLKAHHVPADRARALIDNPGCEICGRDLLGKAKDSTNGKVRCLLVVDHDHACCPAATQSCGRCVRGLICSPCNTALGMLADDPSRARALADYLDNWTGRDV